MNIQSTINYNSATYGLQYKLLDSKFQEKLCSAAALATYS